MKSMPSGHGFPVVLTSEGSTASDTFGSSIAGFISALPDSYIRDWVAHLYFKVKSDKNGIVRRAPYGLAKVQAALIRSGIDAKIIDPNKLGKAVGPNTRILGIYTMDPLGLSYGSGIVYWILKLADLPYSGIPYISKSFLNVINDEAIKKNRDRLKIIVGGPAVWQIIDSKSQHKLGIDVIYEGEFEEEGPWLFHKILRGEPVPNVVTAKRPVPVDLIPTIITPSIGGLVEVTRGCGRGCQFCTPTLSGMIRSIPFEGHIDKEIRLNIEVGNAKEIGLHSEEFFRYGARGINPEPDKVINLVKNSYKVVKSYGDEYSITTDFTTAAVVVQAPRMVREASQYMNEGGARNFIEMGIETGSPRLLAILMPGKVLPFKPIQYPDIVENAIGILNDNGWIVVGTMIINLPGETDNDVEKNLELLDRLRKLRVMTFPLPFIPMGALRHRDFTILDKMLENPLRREFVLMALSKAISEARTDADIITSKMENPVVRRMMRHLIMATMGLVLRRYREKLEAMHSSNYNDEKSMQLEDNGLKHA